MKFRFVGLFLLFASIACTAQEITVAAAADLNYALKEIARVQSQAGKRCRSPLAPRATSSPEFRMAHPMMSFFPPTSTTRESLRLQA